MSAGLRRGFMLALLALSGCRSAPVASAADCAELEDRIVALELHEQGYRDAVLLERKQRGLSASLRAERRQCEGRPLPAGALECARGATSSEELAHRCLR